MKAITKVKTRLSQPEKSLPELPISQSLQEEEIMKWTIKAHPHLVFPVDAMFGVFGFMVGMVYLYGQYHESETFRESTTGSCVFVSLLLIYFYIGARKKTVFNYRITKNGGDVEYWLDHSKYTGHAFKGIAVLSFVVILTLVALDPFFIWALAGPAGMAVAAASGLLKWENEISYSSFEWDRPHLIFVDRTRGLVVLQRRYDPDIPFEDNYLYFEAFLPKHRIDEFLAIARLYAPSGVDYQEGRCYE
ncbi:hypothetical protein [Pseudomonas sp. DWP3-1-2]|uniref:hypothetical protein n=1 Tax=Pseudomonas sp. DWP3-1-2 TaxID=2804645 RepID=UPI003CF48F08